MFVQERPYHHVDSYDDAVVQLQRRDTNDTTNTTVKHCNEMHVVENTLKVVSHFCRKKLVVQDLQEKRSLYLAIFK